jgi:hypothetical protein
MGANRFINQEIYMHYLVNVDHNCMATHLTRGVEGCQKCCISNRMDGLMMICGMAVKRRE